MWISDLEINIFDSTVVLYDIRVIYTQNKWLEIKKKPSLTYNITYLHVHYNHLVLAEVLRISS